MQVNSVNNQNSFGLSISPVVEATLRGAYEMQEISKRAGLQRRTISHANIQGIKKTIKRMFPKATLDIKTIKGADPLASAEGFWRKFSQRANSESQDIVNELIVLRRNGMPDETVLANPMYKKHPLKDILAALKRIQKAEK